MNSNNQNSTKPWLGWLTFLITMGMVFLLGIFAASVTKKRAEVSSIFNNKKIELKGIEARSEMFAENYPREYNTWERTYDTTFQSEFNGSSSKDVLSQRPEMVILWAGYGFSKDYSTPRGHSYAIEDIRKTLRTGSPKSSSDGPMPATCWTCKGPDVPRMMDSVGVKEFYNNTWAAYGNQIVNPIGCADCHDPRTMSLQITRPALVEGFKAMGKNIEEASLQEMRSLVCAQCHVEYYFKKSDSYLTFPWKKGLTMEAAESYYDSIQFVDFYHKLSKAPMIKAQHPDFEIFKTGIHGQRGLSCADCHMPYKSEGGVKYSDHQIRSPLANINNTCQVCHREPEDVLRNNVYERQRKGNELRNMVEKELSTAHIEAQFAWKKGAKEEQMKEVLAFLRQSQWRWDYATASHGASFHSPIEYQRILSQSLDRAHKARFSISKILFDLGFAGNVPLPDISTKQKAQEYIGLDMQKEEKEKHEFIEKFVPQWVKEAKEKNRLLSKS